MWINTMVISCRPHLSMAFRVLWELSSCSGIFSSVIWVNIVPLSFKDILRVKYCQVHCLSSSLGDLLLILASITIFARNTNTLAPQHNTHLFFKEFSRPNSLWLEKNLKTYTRFKIQREFFPS